MNYEDYVIHFVEITILGLDRCVSILLFITRLYIIYYLFCLKRTDLQS